jgi:hypothetical protein
MVKRAAKRVYRELSEAESRRLKQAREEALADRESIIERGRQLKQQKQRAEASLREACQILKTERVAQGLSLSDIETRTGIAKSALSKLENDLDSNPTVTTLTRYAEALGKRLRISLA